MKKKLTLHGMLQKWQISLLAMFLLFYAASAAEINAQEEPALNLSFKNATLTKVFAAIEAQSDYQFTYNKKQVETIRIERILFKAEKLQTVLAYLESQAPWNLKWSINPSA